MFSDYILCFELATFFFLIDLLAREFGPGSDESSSNVVPQATGTNQVVPAQAPVQFPMRTFVCEPSNWHRLCISSTLRKCLIFTYKAIIPRVATCVRAVGGLLPEGVCANIEAFLCQ